MTDAELTARLARPRFPRASKYDGRWIVDNWMGPHVLWLAEYLVEALPLRPGMRVLDLGCGRAVSSIFLAKEFGARVTAADLWIDPGLVTVETADWMPDGHALWLKWCRIVAPLATGFPARASADGAAMLEADREKLFGFTRVVARKDGDGLA